MKKHWMLLVSLMLVFALVLSACSGASEEGTADEGTDAAAENGEGSDTADEGSDTAKEEPAADDKQVVATKIYQSAGKFNDLFAIATPVSEDEDADLALPGHFSTKDQLKEHLLKYGTEEYVTQFIDTYFKEDEEFGLIVNKENQENFVSIVGSNDYEGNGLTVEGEEATFTVTNEEAGKEVTVTAKKDGDTWKIAGNEAK